METRITLFQKKEIRKTTHNNEWWFVITDVVAALTDSPNPQGYLKDMRRRDPALAETLKGGGGNLPPPLALEFSTSGGPQKLQCWHTEGIFRLIQSIPSPKAEPFKRWLARVGYERMQEIENPELAAKRTRAIYQAKGYSEAWIEKLMRRDFPQTKSRCRGRHRGWQRPRRTGAEIRPQSRLPRKLPRCPRVEEPPAVG